jgi:hypothetical protein
MRLFFSRVQLNQLKSAGQLQLQCNSIRALQLVVKSAVKQTDEIFLKLSFQQLQLGKMIILDGLIEDYYTSVHG